MIETIRIVWYRAPGLKAWRIGRPCLGAEETKIKRHYYAMLGYETRVTIISAPPPRERPRDLRPGERPRDLRGARHHAPRKKKGAR